MAITEWRVDVHQDDPHKDLYVVLMEVSEAGEYRWLADESFGPFETATDVTGWIVRHLAPRWKLPLR